LEITAKTVNNHYFKEAALDAAEKIKKGGKLSVALKPYQHIFPIGVIEMMEVGEETGKTATILKKLADFYEIEAINAVEKLAILIEPILIVFLGVAVAFFAISIIQPMYSSLKFVN
jgi:type II secretory pathway component PulF